MRALAAALLTVVLVGVTESSGWSLFTTGLTSGAFARFLFPLDN